MISLEFPDVIAFCRPSDHLITMVRTLAHAKASMQPKHRGTIKKEYGVNVEVTKILGALNYTAAGGGMVADFRFIVTPQTIVVRSYKPGDWEPAVKRAYDDLVAQSGVFAGLTIEAPDVAGDSHPHKKKALFARLIGLFIESD